ncbi:MAG: hypothetical protein R2706_15740 [Acidimicrobiales bacterium]
MGVPSCSTRKATRLLIRDFVPFPAGAELGARLKVTVLTRSTTVDPAALAAVVGRLGVEVVSIERQRSTMRQPN